MSVDINHLVSLAKDGDADAFGELYSLYKNEMYCYACSVVGNSDLAQDAVSEAVLAAFKEIKSLKKTESFKGWLFKILNIACRKQYKLANQFAPINDGVILDTDKQSNDIEQAELSIELNQALNILSEEEREIVLLRTVSEYGSREIAEALGLRDSTVRSKLKRALEKMRNYMNETKGGETNE